MKCLPHLGRRVFAHERSVFASLQATIVPYPRAMYTIFRSLAPPAHRRCPARSVGPSKNVATSDHATFATTFILPIGESRMSCRRLKSCGLVAAVLLVACLAMAQQNNSPSGSTFVPGTFYPPYGGGGYNGGGWGWGGWGM